MPKANVEETGSDIPPIGTEPVSAPGSIWGLGNHRIGCGSATDLELVRRVLNYRSAAVCFADPPSEVADFVGGKGPHRHRERVEEAGELSDGKLLRNSLSVLKVCSSPTAVIYVSTDWQHLMEMTVAGRACGMPLCQIITWVKSSVGKGGIYRNQSEFICVFRAGDETPLDNVERGRQRRNRTNVWHYPSTSSFGKEHDNLLRPTVKPVALIADALRDVTKRGDVVLDTFLNSGWTLIAAQETGRICCGVEFDPLHVDVAIRRWQNTTGRDAILLETGEPFNASARGRLAGPPEANHGE